MLTFLSFMPIIMVAIFVAFAAVVLYDDEKSDDEKLKHDKRKSNKTD